MEKIDAVFTQRSDEDGLTASEIMKLLKYLQLESCEEVYRVIANGCNALAFGFIRNKTVSQALDGDVGENSPFVKDLLAVVNDMALESTNQLYDFAGVRTLMYY